MKVIRKGIKVKPIEKLKVGETFEYLDFTHDICIKIDDSYDSSNICGNNVFNLVQNKMQCVRPGEDVLIVDAKITLY